MRAPSLGEEPGEEEVSQTLALTELPTWEEMARQREALPESYRNALAAERLEECALEIGRASEKAQLDRIIERWRQGQASAVALVGPDGGGKTSILRWLEGKLAASETPYQRFSLQCRIRSEAELLAMLTENLGLEGHSDSVDQLIAKIARRKRQVVIIDNGELLALRAIGSARVIQAFLAIVLATGNHLLWLATLREHAWRRLDYQFGVARHFSEVVSVPYLGEAEFRQALRMVLDSARLPLSLPGTPTSIEEDYRLAEAQSEALTNRLAASLYPLSGGNLGATSFYWTLATRFDEDTQAVRILPGRRVDLSILRSLERFHLFTLAELLSNGGLTCAEHAEIFQRDPMESRLALEYLCRQRLVTRKTSPAEDGETFYQVDSLFFIPVSAELDAAQILY